MSTALPTSAEVEAAWDRVRRKLADRPTRQPPSDRLTGCLEWPSNPTGEGYGTIYMPTALRSEGWTANSLVHRVACHLAHGPSPFSRAQARHLCHNRRCIEPEHLAWGTARQNAEDTSKVARWVTKLTREEVIDIRRCYAKGGGGETMASIAKRYGVSPGTIQDILHGKTWKWLLPPDLTEDPEPLDMAGLLTERLIWLAPPKPDEVSDDDHVNRWVLDMAAGRGIPPSELIATILDNSPASPPAGSEDRYTVAVLSLASRLRVPTSRAVELMGQRSDSFSGSRVSRMSRV